VRISIDESEHKDKQGKRWRDKYLWRRLKVEILVTGYSLRGIIPREECKLPVDVGKVYCVLLDEEGNRTMETKIYAFLAFSDLIPGVMKISDI
jgi:hypothetical protein